MYPRHPRYATIRYTFDMKDTYYRITYRVLEDHDAFGHVMQFTEQRDEAVHGSLSEAKSRAKQLALRYVKHNPDGVEIYQVKRVGKVEIPGAFTRA